MASSVPALVKPVAGVTVMVRPLTWLLMRPLLASVMAPPKLKPRADLAVAREPRLGADHSGRADGEAARRAVHPHIAPAGRTLEQDRPAERLARRKTQLAGRARQMRGAKRRAPARSSSAKWSFNVRSPLTVTPLSVPPVLLLLSGFGRWQRPACRR